MKLDILRTHNIVRRCMRSYSMMEMNIFDRKTKQHQRDVITRDPNYEQYFYLKDEIGFRVFDRLCDVKRTFDIALDLGCGLGHVASHITSLQQLVNHRLYMVESSSSLLENAKISTDVPCIKVHCDEETLDDTPLVENSVDLVYSSLSLHWVNNLPGLFRKVLKLLKPDGVFIASLFGTDTIYELRVCLQLAEQEILGGVYPHVSPFTTVRDMGDLLNSAGYTLITLDSDELVVNYPGIWELMRDLKGMGESNCSWSRPLTLRRDVIKRAEEIYRERYGNADGSIPATFCILSFVGWKPDPSQPSPAQRGSGTASIKEISDFVTQTNQSSPPER